jgi:hypothetical protein
LPDLTIKQHDTFPPLQATLSDENGPIDLTNANAVLFIMKGTKSTGAVLVTGACTYIDRPNGVVQYAWATGDTAVPDTYDIEFQITWSSGGIQTIPNAALGANTIVVTPDAGP